MDELFGAAIATSLVKMAVFLPVLFFPVPPARSTSSSPLRSSFVGISTFNALTFSPISRPCCRLEKPRSSAAISTPRPVFLAIYGLLSAGNGAAALIPTVIGVAVGHRRQDHRSAAASSLHRGWCCSWRDHTGVIAPIRFRWYTAIGGVVGYFVPLIFTFNRLYGGFEALPRSSMAC